MTTATKPTISWMTERDLDQIAAIEAECFDSAWTKDDFRNCLRERNCIGMVAEYDKSVVGYMLYELHKSYMEFLRFAVHPRYQREGVGVAMVDKMKSKLSSHRRNRIVIRVRDSNLPAHLFFRASGFDAVRVERGYYRDTNEDAYVFVHRYKE